jgi:hypothetical protein
MVVMGVRSNSIMDSTMDAVSIPLANPEKDTDDMMGSSDW